MFFTLEDYRKIEEYLRLNSKKDTDFPTAEEITDDDYIPIILDAVNKKMTVLDLRIGLSKGPRGESAYEVAVRHGYVGTEEEWLDSLEGKSAYLIAVELGYIGTEEDWINSLKGDKGDTGNTPIVKLSENGMDILISSDNGETWYKLVPDFNKLKVLGYVDTVEQLPRNANLGDIYGVWNPDVYSGRVDELGHLLKGAYDMYINTVTDWILESTITKVYSYDTELPSVARDGSVAIVPVKDLTLDKEKVDGYKVYKYNLASHGWILILNTAEIYNSKEDIINKGDNIYALVQGNGYVTETKLREETVVSKKDYCRISNMTDEPLLLIITLDSKRMFHSISSGTYMLPNNCGVFLVNDHDLTDVVIAASMSDPAPKELSSLEYMPEGIYPYYILTESSAGDIYITPLSKLNPEHIEEQEGLTVETKITTLLSFSQTYELYRRVVNWAFFGTNASITYRLVLNVDEGTETNVLSGKAVKEATTFTTGEKVKETGIDGDITDDESLNLVRTKAVTDRYGKYIDNPEFIKVVTDNEGNLLYGVQRDGSFYFGAGVPEQVLDYVIQLGGIIKEELITLIELEKARAIAAEETKVDKEEGKSLIDKDFADGIRYIENPEFKEIKLDNENRILEAIMNDGTKLLPAGADLGCAIVQTVSNPEFLCAWVDSTNHIIAAFKSDGDILLGAGVPSLTKEYIKEELTSKVDKEEGKSLIDEEYANGIHYMENPEFVEVKLDDEDRILEATMADSTKLLPAGLKTPSIDLEGATVKHVDNPEFVDMVTDANDKILYGVTKDGDFIDGKGNIQKAVETGKKLNNLNIGIDIDRGVLRICGKLYKLIAYEGEADIDDGSVSNYFGFIELTTEVENLEFSRAITDHDDRLLYGQRHDGTEYEPDLSGYTMDGVSVSRIVNNLK